MSIRNPVRLLDITDVSKGYPNELLVDFTTGNFTILNSDKTAIQHKKPGTIIVKQGSTTVLNTTDLSSAVTLNLPTNSPTATTLQTARTIGLSGVTATAQSFDGSGNITIPITAVPAAIVSGLSTVATSGSYNDLSNKPTIPTPPSPATTAPKAAGTATVGTSTLYAREDHVHPLQTTISGNAGTATKLSTARTINIAGAVKGSASFDGSANITINTTPRRITRQGFTGSGNPTWWYKIGTMVIDNSGNYGNYTIDGRIGGWTNENSAVFNIMLMNRANYTGDTITATVASYGNVTSALNLTDIQVFKQTDLSHTVWLKCNGYFLFDFAYTEFQHSMSYPGDSNYQTDTPTGTLVWSLKTSNKTIMDTTGLFSVVGAGVASANKLSTARTITLSGGVTGSASFDGSANVTINTTVTGIPSAATTAPLVAGTAAVGTSTTYARADHVHPLQTTVSGNAGTATKLATARTISLSGGVTGSASFDGSANISISTSATLATASVAGAVSTTTQTFAGAKTFSTSVTTPSLTVSTKGNVSGIAIQYTATLSTSWSGSSPYTQVITVSGVKTTDTGVWLDVKFSGTYSTDKSYDEAFSGAIYRAVVTATNQITVYAHTKPTIAIPVMVTVVR